MTLLTGFLGAGKTTLLNRILADFSAGRIAVIVNEFGEAGLDHDLIETVEDEVVLMQSGCLCCSVRGDLSQTFADLLAQRQAGTLHFDRVVIETTGMADPGPILQTLLVDRLLARNTRMDGVVTVVDAVNGPTTLDAQFESVSQVAMADLILLSKTDLVDGTAVEDLTHRLRGLNQTAPILRQSVANDAADRLWGLSGLRRSATPQDVIAWTTPDPFANLSGIVPKPLETPGFTSHDSRISSVSIVLDHPLQDAAFDLWLDTLIALKGPDILRVKGIVFLEGFDTPFVFHGVQHIFDPPVPIRTWSSEDRSSRIVVIGRDLTRPELQRSFDVLRAGQPTPQTYDFEDQNNE
ncbi:CobW family GTP-binding protein [Thalassovita gelatinovora]|uniref:CobW family GTP-binding protein n=1 Tax=Thalassovita gelatinovora TaxID=53501 RepID=UPI001F274EE2|nr:GTP-binding protein [Thalassovita gelatinovora]